ncbi:MAG: hypothetical protein A3D31_04785 [Candidatus Fluviicola riflensis]|nr:MAG: hypothetical protein CHH17_10235 [Candidatus Fluviicola riflensis]OGS79292.1 MAG: hypothetical protein A3D31_04785 [Candidatus Fluviicola riflensis]OGS86724.1 MAG: hypothetical protein A2724_04245 [Fluviicola sp. RIFCSPHIGHO2_01_FULL_43_53]OGS88802.1 MAG: hypothetical protein A3E30_00415 [Fluviicola sp. RIFCSPHIGHO2_12_FULL_43_24]
MRFLSVLFCAICAIAKASAACDQSALSQKDTLIYEDGGIRCVAEMQNKRLNGTYLSYYRNGQKKASGEFVHNCRTGVWTVWDSTGRMRVTRVYTNLFEFDQTFPVASTDPPVELLNKSIYELAYNEKGFIDYFTVQERMVLWSKRVWRMITPEENPKLFEEDAFYQILTKNIQSEKLKCYSAENELFASQLIISDNPDNYKVISYKLKEDNFFDNERLLSESRILGICPVAIDLKTKDTVDLYWIYFPHLRSCLAAEITPYQSIDASDDIRTFDDLFFFRDFYGEIYKESNISDKPISAYASSDEERAKEIQRIEISMIEIEHDFWMSFAR